MVRKITFKIDEHGEVNLSVEGATGSSCEDFSAPFESKLGQIAGRELKDSYYEEASQGNQEEVSSSD